MTVLLQQFCYFEEFITLKRLVRLRFLAVKSHSSVVNTLSQYVSKAVVLQVILK